MRNVAKHPRNRRLEVESLESMTLLSGMTAVVGHPLPAAQISSQTIPLPIIVGLKGTTHGVYNASSFPDVGTSYSVYTAGKFQGYGPGVVYGTLHSLGFLASGQATGTLHVILPGGTLTLTLTGPTQKGFSPLPKQFSFEITKGTGKFHNATGDPVGKGTVSVALKPGPGAGAGLNGHGQVTLTFVPGIVAIA